MNQEVVLIVFQVVVLVLAFSIHESAHAWTAWRLGDPTAKMLGRVTLNPLKHLDPFGSVLMPLLALVYHWPLIGWAKPTPVTARNFKNYRRDDILVTLAGPLSNLLSATVALILLVLIKHVVPGGVVAIGTAMALASHIPGIATDNLPALFPIALFLYFVILINLLLFVFNLIPIPPLDGSHVLRHFLPYRALQVYDRFGMFGMILLFLVGGSFIFSVFFTPLLNTFNHILFTL
ncbi:site-2 protease family protein [Tunturibacter empetritectus]|uniref:Zn-dependent protease n=1 Tax=Tunturiibacter lichenicola TaxID=2051959 RepID=A0A7W8J6Q5_9BACT|nr:site-2 protease family protein [Edaphobacter lichenicola]MBB5343570.1 Zn-dependent protease [Edaphobacter lichenicola]